MEALFRIYRFLKFVVPVTNFRICYKTFGKRKRYDDFHNLNSFEILFEIYNSESILLDFDLKEGM